MMFYRLNFYLFSWRPPSCFTIVSWVMYIMAPCTKWTAFVARDVPVHCILVCWLYVLTALCIWAHCDADRGSVKFSQALILPQDSRPRDKLSFCSQLNDRQFGCNILTIRFHIEYPVLWVKCDECRGQCYLVETHTRNVWGEGNFTNVDLSWCLPNVIPGFD